MAKRFYDGQHVVPQKYPSKPIRTFLGPFIASEREALAIGWRRALAMGVLSDRGYVQIWNVYRRSRPT